MKTTNNILEYDALIIRMKTSLKLNVKNLNVRNDSHVVTLA